ncbi:MAG: NADH-quinone oxidoreductase subunit K [Bdellovibrionales bacterium RBG_16_40_8]|nr:MAG: NADH-quinone oxidoreductase subunit K [Bdellovibrionales bacterium RBG_16_40_8]
MTIMNWLQLTLLLFSIGIYGILTRRSAVGILISVELMLNAGAINFVVFNKYVAAHQVSGQVMSIFVIALAAAEVMIGLAILIMIFRQRRSVDVTKMDTLKN